MSPSPLQRVVAVASLVVLAGSLAACSGGGGEGGGGAADFSGVQSATIQIESDGTFANPDNGQSEEQAGLGSGFFISADGLALTNNHVVVGAGTMKVRVGGEDTDYDAEILGSSECLDLAVIKVDGSGFPYLGW